jgi:ubiquinone biosynthesis protein COQ4
MTIEIPPSPARAPVRWRRAFAELRALIRTPEETDHAMHLAYALGGRRELERSFRRFAASPSGAALLAERPSLVAALGDREALARLPAGSLGRAYLAYLDANGFAAAGLLEVERRVEAQWLGEGGVAPLDPLRAWFRDRTLLAHDLFHVLTDYGTDELGEATLLAFTLAQLGGRAQMLLTLGAALEVWRTLGRRWLAYDFRAWRRGRRALWLAALPWEELLPLRVATVRRLAGVCDADVAHLGGVLRGSLQQPAYHRA